MPDVATMIVNVPKSGLFLRQKTAGKNPQRTMIAIRNMLELTVLSTVMLAPIIIAKRNGVLVIKRPCEPSFNMYRAETHCLKEN
jgi:hypothetical protein